MKTRKKRIIRSLELDEISAVGTPAQAGALHKITKAAPATPEPRFPTAAEAAKALTGANPAALEIFKSQQEHFSKMLAEFSNPKDSDTMTDPNYHYNKAVSDFAERRNLSIAKAAEVMAVERMDLIEAAYSKDEYNRALRLKAENDRRYGGAA